MKSIFAATLLLAILFATPGYARHVHNRTVTLAPECNVIMPCDGGSYSPFAKRLMNAPFGVPLQHYTPQRPVRQAVPTRDARIIGSRPAGCPHAFCGCEASLYLFGRIVPSLNLAANWLKFPRAIPAPRMAAARYGHVMVLVEHRGGNIWLVHDGNSGGHMTRLHERSIHGYTVVNPNV